jgi:tRNA threonylcarbamoyladenosine biosynthesis protein TsaB
LITLACDTSTLLGSVALIQDGKIVAEKKSMRQGSHSDNLHPTIIECLQAADIQISDVDSFATGIGPGSFTGIRVSLNTLKTYSFIHQKPCYVMDSLANIALQAHLKQPSTGRILVIINAFKNMVYTADFISDSNKLVQLSVPAAVHVRELTNNLKDPVLCLGDGFLAYESYFSQHAKNLLNRSLEHSDYPLASTIALTAQLSHEHLSKFVKKMSWQDLLPIYLRASEAEENLQGIKFSPL